MSVHKEVEWTIDSIFESTDCETCGSSFEELTVTWDGYRFHAHYSVGCYGGGGKSDMDYDTLVAWLGDALTGENGLPAEFITHADYLALLAETQAEWDGG